MRELDVHFEPDQLIAPQGGQPHLQRVQQLGRQSVRNHQSTRQKPSESFHRLSFAHPGHKVF